MPCALLQNCVHHNAAHDSVLQSAVSPLHAHVCIYPHTHTTQIVKTLILEPDPYKYVHKSHFGSSTDMPSMDTLDGYSFAFNARVDLVGQGCDVATEIVRHS